MLANTQFIENRVYDDDGVDHEAVEAEAKAKEEEEKRAAKMDPSQVQVRWTAALSAGLGALAFKVRVVVNTLFFSLAAARTSARVCESRVST